ncbi:nuclear transport factor 2 family protein [Streptomyces sp. NPDC051985]|uniref:nuclear transport factor 2 family protein n=1 Tax=Streptomyces sp. NPDC051985 TaxID=3155807 RepID=UPI003429F096
MADPGTELRQIADIAARQAVRRVVEECARRGDRRDTSGQLALFAPEARLAVYYGHQRTDQPVATFQGHEEIARALAAPDDGRHLYHFLGQTTIELDGDTAAAETLCIAHQLSETDAGRLLRTTHNRYADSFRRIADTWLLTSRDIFLAWAEDRTLGDDAMAPPTVG